jgi:hypothetical protein
MDEELYRLALLLICCVLFMWLVIEYRELNAPHPDSGSEGSERTLALSGAGT